MIRLIIGNSEIKVFIDQPQKSPTEELLHSFDYHSLEKIHKETIEDIFEEHPNLRQNFPNYFFNKSGKNKK